MASNLIISAGMPRSGSTWLYNATRLVLLSSPEFKDDLACGWIDDRNNLAESKNTLIKIHEFDKRLSEQAYYTIYSYRDVRDSLASINRKFGRLPSLDAATHLIKMHDKWTRVADIIVPYEKILSSKKEIITDLAQALAHKVLILRRYRIK